MEPLLEIDGDIRSFEVFLSSRTPVLTARDVEMFLPCTVNLDPKLREIIAGAYRNSTVAMSTIYPLDIHSFDASVVMVEKTNAGPG